MPVFPDFDLWKYPFAQVIFDAEPYKTEEHMSEAILRGQADHVVVYFVPTEATLDKRRIDEVEERDYIYEEEYEYIKTHEYNFKITNTQTKKEFIENYFFIQRDNEVVYNELVTRINLTKRRVKQAPHSTYLLAIKHRDLNEAEANSFLARLAKIEPKKKKEPGEDDEENAKSDQEEMDVEERPKEEDVKMTEADADDDDDDDDKESVDSDDKSSSEKDDKSDESDESDSEPELYRKKDQQKHSKSRVVHGKPAVKSDSEKSSSSASGSSSSASDSEDDKKSSSSSSSDDESDDDKNASRKRQREHQHKKSKKKYNDNDVTRIFGSDSD